jgi:hypothetical protein
MLVAQEPPTEPATTYVILAWAPKVWPAREVPGSKPIRLIKSRNAIRLTVATGSSAAGCTAADATHGGGRSLSDGSDPVPYLRVRRLNSRAYEKMSAARKTTPATTTRTMTDAHRDRSRPASDLSGDDDHPSRRRVRARWGSYRCGISLPALAPVPTGRGESRRSARASRAMLKSSPHSPKWNSADRRTPAIQLRAVDLKARESAPLVLHFKEANCDGFLECRARQLQSLVLRHGRRARLSRSIPCV